jgi:hypothetical protein
MKTRRKQLAKHNITQREQQMYGGDGKWTDREFRIPFSDFINDNELERIIKQYKTSKSLDTSINTLIQNLRRSISNKTNIKYDRETPLTKKEYDNVLLGDNRGIIQKYFSTFTGDKKYVTYSTPESIILKEVIDYDSGHYKYTSDIFTNPNNPELKLLYNAFKGQSIYKNNKVTITNSKALEYVGTRNKLIRIINKLFRLPLTKAFSGRWNKIVWPLSSESDGEDILENDSGNFKYLVDNGQGYCVMEGKTIRKFKLFVDNQRLDMSEAEISDIASKESDIMTHTINYSFTKTGDDQKLVLNCTLTPCTTRQTLIETPIPETVVSAQPKPTMVKRFTSIFKGSTPQAAQSQPAPSQPAPNTGVDVTEDKGATNTDIEANVTEGQGTVVEGQIVTTN